MWVRLCAMGYPSVEAYQKRELPDWKDSVLPERGVTACGMRKDEPN